MNTHKKIDHLRAALVSLEAVEAAGCQDDDDDLSVDDLEFLSEIGDWLGEMVRDLAARLAPQ